MSNDGNTIVVAARGNEKRTYTIRRMMVRLGHLRKSIRGIINIQAVHKW